MNRRKFIQSLSGTALARPLTAVWRQPPGFALVQLSAVPAPDNSTASTRVMASLLRQIFQGQDWKTDPYKPGERISYYRSVLNLNLNSATEMAVREALATQFMIAGDSADAVRQLEQVRELLAAQHGSPPPDVEHGLHEQLGIAWLRLAQQQACIAPDGKTPCGSAHQAAAAAVREYTALLRENPRDTQARWMLNIADMRLGGYPAEVPREWLIPQSLFRSEYPLPRFDDVAAAAGLDMIGHAGGAVMEDFDGDGLLDIVVSGVGPTEQLRMFHNQGDGTFKDVTREAGLLGETGGLNVICADYDNDGHPDLLVLRGGWWAKHGSYPMSLLRNRGDGTFTDVTSAAGLLSMHPTQTAAFADFDNDGWLDIIVPHESTPGDPRPTQLFHNNGDGTFTDIAAACGLADMGFVKGVAWGDYNNDGRPDLYFSIKDAPNRLYRNDGPFSGDDPRHVTRWRFADVTDSAHVAEPKESLATWFFDYDNDGWPDLFVAGYSAQPGDIGAFVAGEPVQAEMPRLYRNQRNGTFRDVTREVHLDRAILVMGANFGDLDNDGFLDIYLGTGELLYTGLLPNRMFRNDGGRRFQDVTAAGGFGSLQKGHGVAFGDLDNDGYEEVFQKMGGALPGDIYPGALYRNPGMPGTHSVTLTLIGTRSNRSAIGALVHVQTRDSRGKPRSIYRTVGFGSSFGGNPLRQHIGLGQCGDAVDVEVRWPSSATPQRFSGLLPDRAYILTEGVRQPKPANYRRFKLPSPGRNQSGQETVP